MFDSRNNKDNIKPDEEQLIVELPRRKPRDQNHLWRLDVNISRNIWAYGITVITPDCLSGDRGPTPRMLA